MLCDLSFCACVARPALSPLTSCANNRSEAAHGRRLRNAGQPTSGTKAELLRRLKSGSAPAAATGHPPGPRRGPPQRRRLRPRLPQTQSHAAHPRRLTATATAAAPRGTGSCERPPRPPWAAGATAAARRARRPPPSGRTSCACRARCGCPCCMAPDCHGRKAGGTPATPASPGCLLCNACVHPNACSRPAHPACMPLTWARAWPQHGKGGGGRFQSKAATSNKYRQGRSRGRFRRRACRLRV